jgi:hypothetical protein
LDFAGFHRILKNVLDGFWTLDGWRLLIRVNQLMYQK